MSTERFVLEALQKGVIAAIAASSNTDLPVKMAGRVLETPSEDKWLEVVQIPNNSENNWGNEKLYQGMLRLVLHWPTDDRGAYDPMDLLFEIGGYFTKGRKLSDTQSNVEVTVSMEPDFMGIIEEGSEVLFPASLEYRYYSS